MAAYLTFTIIGERSQSRHGTKEVQIKVRALARPDEETATWLLQEKYPSAKVTHIVVDAAHSYREVTAASLATKPLRRQKAS